LIELGGWRLPTDPTFDPAGEHDSFARGHRLGQDHRSGDRRRRASPHARGADHPVQTMLAVIGPR